MRILVMEYKDRWHSQAGGAEFYSEAIAKEMTRLGHEVTVFASESDCPIVDEIDGVEYVRLGNKFTVFHAATKFLMRHGDEFDLVLDTVNQRPFLAHEIVGDKATALVHHLGLEAWNSEFGFPYNVIGRRILEPRWMERLRDAPRVAAVSASTAHALARYGVHCLGIIPPAMPEQKPILNKRFGSNPRVLFIGRLVNNKRPFDAVRAFRLMKKDFPTLSMDVVGNGYLLERLGKCADLDLRVWGFLPEEEKELLIRQADLLFVTSVREGWGMVVAEAGIAGVPAVAYRVPGLRDSIDDRVTGVLTSETPAALAAAATEILNDRDYWASLSRAAAVRASSWHWSKAAECLLDVMMTPPSSESKLLKDTSPFAQPVRSSSLLGDERSDDFGGVRGTSVTVKVLSAIAEWSYRSYASVALARAQRHGRNGSTHGVSSLVP